MLRDKVIKYIEDTFSSISPETVEIYKRKFSGMSDKEIKEYFKTGKVRLYVKDKEVNEDELDKLVDKLKIIPQERIVLPYKNNATSLSEAMIFPVQIRRLQQLATKQSKSSFETHSRDKAGQASGYSKTGRISDPEVNQLASLGLDKTLTELLSPRSDNLAGKKAMNEQIFNTLTFELAKTPTNKKDKATLQYIDALYKSINMATDFIDYIDDIS